VVAVNYRTPELTARAVRLATEAAAPFHVQQIVVDNGATEASTASLRAALPGATVVPLTENRGFGAGVNAGAAVATSGALFVVNSDAFCRPGAVACLLRYLDRDAAVGIVAPRLLHEDGRVQGNAYRRFPNLLTLFFDFCAPLHPLDGTPLHPHSVTRARLSRPGRVAHVMGAAFVVRRSALEASGGFDERYFLYLEETEWQRRVSERGWEIHLEPSAEVVHAERASSGAQVVSRHYLVSAQRYFRSPRSARVVMRSGAAVSLLAARLAGRLRPSDPRFPKLVAAYRDVLTAL
jgi:N-acetylglucosaminyl-diphospho-decaprenol L-rhamnosyltransferase